ncbi:MAG: DUF1328 domain-containing protein [Chlamydiae bacterium]|nr:DUF1328 domain-containing protein [Chlamydiota bacterium]
MLTLATIFLIVGIICGLYGFSGDKSFSSYAGKFLFFIFTTLFIISLIYSFLPEPKGVDDRKINYNSIDVGNL